MAFDQSRMAQFKNTLQAGMQKTSDFVRGPVQATTPTPGGQVTLRQPSGLSVALNNTMKQARSPGFVKQVALPAAGRGAAVGYEAAQAYNDINSGQLPSTSEKVSRVGEGISRLGAAALGAKFGAMTPVPGGAVIGGTAGYFAPEAVRMLANTLTGGDNFELPSERVSRKQVKAPLKDKPVAMNNQTGDLDLSTGEATAAPMQQVASQDYMGIQQELSNLPTQRTMGPKQGYEPLNVNAKAQDLIASALRDVRNIRNQANADTLGGAVAQKVENNNLTQQAQSKSKLADQLNNFGASSINMRQGEQQLTAGDVGIDQARQNLVGGKVNVLGGQQKLVAGQQEIDRAQLLRDTLQEYSITKDPERRQELANIALTMQGKEPKLPFEFKEAGDAMTGKVLYRINNRTGQAEVVAGGQPSQQYVDGQQYNVGGQVKVWSADQGQFVNP